MKQNLLFLLCFFLSSVLFGQELSSSQKMELEEVFGRGQKEVYFQLKPGNKKMAGKLGQIISIDHNSTAELAYAYANRNEFAEFLTLGLDYNLLPHPGISKNPVSMVDVKGLTAKYNWNQYPTYEAYEQMLHDFVTNHPNFCKLSTFATLESGRQLFLLHISSNVKEEHLKPKFLYTAQIHGDEMLTYMLMLRLADHLLTNYGQDEQITRLLDQINIYINPLANPDGTYSSGNHTVNGATRTNANGIDLNRNFPDPEDGIHPDGNDYQPETLAFMQLAQDYGFHMSANLHSGIELANYPWDTWQKRHADDDWWSRISRMYATSAQTNSPSGYFDDLDNGITNGYDWYEVAGGRQDYMNFFNSCRELTLENSNTKFLPASQLDDYWNYNKEALLNYLEQVIYGVQGKILDSESLEPIEDVKVFIANHDQDSSWVFSDEQGMYFRPIEPGKYKFTFSSAEYDDFVIDELDVSSETAYTFDISMVKNMNKITIKADNDAIAKGQLIQFEAQCQNEIDSYLWTFENAEPSQSTEENPIVLWDKEGVFDISLQATVDGEVIDLFKEDFVEVSAYLKMQNAVVSVLDCQFTDDGGLQNNYSANKNYQMHILPYSENHAVELLFEEFNVEADSKCDFDYLKVYNGSDASAPLIGKFCGEEIPEYIIAQNDNGDLFLEFVSDGGEEMPGWKGIIRSVIIEDTPEIDRLYTHLYPNPVSGNQINIETAASIKEVQLINLQGGVLRKISPDNSSCKLDLTGVSEGVYLLNIISADGHIAVRKILRK